MGFGRCPACLHSAFGGENSKIVVIFSSSHLIAQDNLETEKWLKEFNEERPHDALGDMTPREYLLTQNPNLSTYGWT